MSTEVLISPHILSILSEVFGYESFRGPQRDIIEHVTSGQDALVLMPTGGGKSLCYQIQPLHGKTLALASPLWCRPSLP